jgi:hypothetical protein
MTSPADPFRQRGHRHARGPAATVTMTSTAPFPTLTASGERYGVTVSTNRRSCARNVRFYTLIFSVVFMLILSDREQVAADSAAATIRAIYQPSASPATAVWLGTARPQAGPGQARQGSQSGGQ